MVKKAGITVIRATNAAIDFANLTTLQINITLHRISIYLFGKKL